jgi:hypothetical protein
MLRKCSLLLASFLALAIPVVPGPTDPARADDERAGAVRLLTTVPVPGTLQPLRAFDISWLDAASQLYYLADRSNASVDVVNAKTNQFVATIKAGFAGVAFQPNPSGPGFVADNARSGPNGVVVGGRWLFVTDAGSRVVSIDLTANPPAQVDELFTAQGDPLRADELAYDPRDGVLLVVNNADDPPFATLITVNKATGKLTLGAQIIFDSAHTGVDATNGAEQPVWDPGTRKFYLSIPEINCPGGHDSPPAAPCGGGFHLGGVVRIDPHSTGAVDALFQVSFCQPAGLTLGPPHDLLLGCSQAFDAIGQAWSAADTNTAKPISVIMDARTGSIDKSVEGVSGNDEVWFNPGDRRYYLAARANPTGPVLGVIDAERQTLVQLVPTINTAGKPTATPPIPSGTSHSVAVDPVNNHAMVPLPANNVFPDCLNGCIGVFGIPTGDVD